MMAIWKSRNIFVIWFKKRRKSPSQKFKQARYVEGILCIMDLVYDLEIPKATV